MKTCCFCYPSKTIVISYAHHQKKKKEGILALLLVAHLLLQGDFFLTSRYNPPEMNESGNWETMQLDEEA